MATRKTKVTTTRLAWAIRFDIEGHTQPGFAGIYVSSTDVYVPDVRQLGLTTALFAIRRAAQAFLHAQWAWLAKTGRARVVRVQVTIQEVGR